VLAKHFLIMGEKSYIKLYSESKKSLQIFLSPLNVFQELDKKPTWLLPFLIISIGTFIIAYLTSPYSIQAGISNLPSDMSPDQHQSLLRTIQKSQTIGIVLSPLFIFIKLSINAFV